MLTRWLSFALLFGVLLTGIARTGAADPAPVYNPANGHWYQVVTPASALSWQQDRDAAAALSYAGFAGHLATVTSPAENQFIWDNVVQHNLAHTDYLLGGYQDRNAPDYREPAGGWRWVTGEPWSFTLWAPGEPNDTDGIEDVLGYWSPQLDHWNDFNPAPRMVPFIVEYEPPFSQSPAGSGQLVLFPNPALGGQPALGQVTLARPAGAGGEIITLTNSNPAAAAVPATVTVPGGASSATFVITTLPVTAPTPVVISAGCNFGSASATLQVLPLAAPVPVPVNLLVNGSFEQPPVPAGQAYRTLGPGELPGWNIVRGTVDVHQQWQQAPGQGSQSLGLVGDRAGTVEQSFTTVPGQQYLFSGWISHDYGAGVPEGRADVYLNGAFFVQLYHNAPSSQTDMQWMPFSYRFRATGSVTTLRLADVTGLSDLRGLVLDGLSVSPIGDSGL